MSIIEQIKAEVERLKATNPSEYNYQNAEGYVWALDDIISFLSTLESEKPFKEPIDGVLYAATCGIKNKGQIEESEKPIPKDLALTWKDVRNLCDCFMDVGLESNLPARSKEFYTEVLNRFNKSKEKK